MQHHAPPAPRWMSRVLLAAALYNVAWGALVVLAPAALFDWTGTPRPAYLPIWQCVGMIVGVYGIGYAAAALNPLRHWPIVLVGFLGKVFGPLGFLVAGLEGDMPWSFGWLLLTNDLIWWVPFGLILAATYRSGVPTAELAASGLWPRSPAAEQ